MSFSSLSDIAVVDAGLATNIETIYAWNRCGLIADLLNRETGLPIMLLDHADDFAHAAIVVEQSARHRKDWLVGDVMGIRPVGEFKAIYEEKMGPLRLKIVDDLPENYCSTWDTEEIDEGLLLLIGRLPWLRSMVPDEFRQSDDSRIVSELRQVMSAVRDPLRVMELMDELNGAAAGPKSDLSCGM